MSPPANLDEGQAEPVGQNALHKLVGARLPAPHVQSWIAPRARHTRETPTSTQQTFPPDYRTDGSLKENLSFAFKHEALDLGVVFAALSALGPTAIEAWVRDEPTGIFSRRAWFFYELLTGQNLDLQPVRIGRYVDALDSRRHFVADAENSPRHRVRNNLLGSAALCPTVRRTPTLEAAIASRLDRRIREVATDYAPDELARAVNFLYTRETRSSFALEGEAPNPNREQRFLEALRHAAEFDSGSKDSLLNLQNIIVEPRYAARDWRTVQNFVGETTRSYEEYVHYICPRPEDVPALMDGWTTLVARMLSSPSLDPVTAAAVSAFAFVFVHPFDDGNGRIHRFLIHHMLAKRQYTPPGILFPVSSAILRQRHLYDAALEAFSHAIQPFIQWRFDSERSLIVSNATRDLYRFFDATVQTEYLYARMAETLTTDFRGELSFLRRFDAALAALRHIVDMPDNRARFLAKLILQNNGRLSKNKRRLFDELSDEEVRQIEGALQPHVQDEKETA